MPTLEDVRKKEVKDWDDNDKKVLADNKSQLTADEIIAAGLVEASDIKIKEDDKKDPIVNADAKPNAQGIQIDAATQQILADITSGKKVLIEAAEFNSLKSSVDQLAEVNKKNEREKIEASVDVHVKRGAIKQDQAEEWANKIEADATMLPLLASLKDDPLLAQEVGSGAEGDAAVAQEQIHDKVLAHIKTEKEAGKDVSYSDALMVVASANPDLAKEHDANLNGALEN